MILSSLQAKRERDLSLPSTPHRPQIRALILLIDASDAMNEEDIKPSRWAFLCTLLKANLNSFFDTNPLSQLCLIITSQGKARLISNFGNSPAKHIESLLKVKDIEGEPSLENGLKLSLALLDQCPVYTHKEVLILYGALNTCDPGNVFEVVDEYKSRRIPVSCISLSVMVNLNKEIAEATQGNQHTILSQSHFQKLLKSYLENVTNPKKSKTTSLIHIGFPNFNPHELSLCSCHGELKSSTFTCPRCGAKECGIPAVCRVCQLLLGSSAHLAKTQKKQSANLEVFPTFWEYIFRSPWDEQSPMPPITKAQMERMGHILQGSSGAPECMGCSDKLQLLQTPESLNSVSVCQSCQSLFCLECDMFLHTEYLRCPGCAKK